MQRTAYLQFLIEIEIIINNEKKRVSLRKQSTEWIARVMSVTEVTEVALSRFKSKCNQILYLELMLLICCACKTKTTTADTDTNVDCQHPTPNTQNRIFSGYKTINSMH